jgi:hypothetical protein
MSERRGRVWGFLLTAIFVAAGMASCAHPALSQHPTTHNPPPPRPRPPHHQPPPPQRQVVKQQASQPQKAVAPQPSRQQESGIPGAATPQSPAIGSRVNTGVPHPPVRPWEQRNADIPASERPPPGMCRVWLDNVPAGSQPAPTSCAKAIQTHPANGHVIFGEDGGRPTATRVAPAAPAESSPQTPQSPELPFHE